MIYIQISILPKMPVEMVVEMVVEVLFELLVGMPVEI